MTQEPAPGAEHHAAHDFRQRLIARWPTMRRRQVVIVVATLAIFVATFIASSRLLRYVFDDLDVLAYAGLFLACWIGAGGGLVPVPGVRAISWLMIVQQGAALDPVTVALVAALAMVLGQSSYFLATRATRQHLAENAAHKHEAQSAGTHELPASPGSPAPGDPQPTTPQAHESAVAGSRRARAMASARRRITYQVQDHGIATVFVVCALPTPLTTLTTTAASASGMRYPRFFVAALSGFLLLSSILALFGQGLVLAFQSVFPVR